MRLIDADVVFAKLNKICVTDDLHGMGVAEGVAKAMGTILNTPTIEAEPVRHGRWEQRTDFNGFLTCSNCHNCNIIEEVFWRYANYNYCPNCGAKMDLEGG
jgi:hypothetical protein